MQMNPVLYSYVPFKAVSQLDETPIPCLLARCQQTINTLLMPDDEFAAAKLKPSARSLSIWHLSMLE